MPLVDAYAISFAAPLFMVGPVGADAGRAGRLAALDAPSRVGFVGVLVMLDPLGISVHCHVAGRSWRDLLLLAVDRARRA